MSYGDKTNRLKIKLILGSLLTVFAYIFAQGTASAAAPQMPIPTQYLPQSSHFTQGNRVHLLVARYGSDYVLEAENSTVRIYSKYRHVALNIIDGRHCLGSGRPDRGPDESEATSIFNVYALRGQESDEYPNTPFARDIPRVYRVTSDNLDCGSTTIDFNSVYSEPLDRPGDPFDGLWAFEFEALYGDSGGQGWNMFKLQIVIREDGAIAQRSAGRLSYYAGSGDKFAIKANGNGIPGDPGDYHLAFAPSCYMATPTRTVKLKWFDADAGQGNQPPPPPYVITRVYEYDLNNNPTGTPVTLGNLDGASNGGTDSDGARVIRILSGDNVPGSAEIVIKRHHKYVWIHEGIYSANGIQFELPYDSYNVRINNCPKPDNSTCRVTAGGQTSRIRRLNVSPGQSVPATYQFRNTGTLDWGTTDYRYRRTVDGSSSTAAFSTTVASGTNAPTISRTETAPASGTRQITYRMLHNGAAFGETCLLELRAGAPTTSPNISVGCSTTTVNIPAASIRARWRPPPDVHNLPYEKITKVPFQIRVTDTDSGASSTYTNPDAFVDISGGDGQKQLSTFGLWRSNDGMWPHRNYNLTLIIRGTLAEDDGTSYNNDGNWDEAIRFTPREFNTESIGECISASCSGNSSADLEPGQTTTLSAGFSINNETQETYSDSPTGGYYARIDTEGGIFGAPGNVGITIPPGSNQVNASFIARIDYTGSYWGTLMFQGSEIELGQNGSCPSQEITPAARPFLQVWGGDINTGGGFETVGASGALTCPSAYPNYVSPATTGDGNYGGIKSFYDPNTRNGSLSDFGALSIGLIARDDGKKINFVAQPSFSNTTSPYWGRLDSSSPSYCIINYFERTQNSPATNNNPSNIAALTGSSSNQYISQTDVSSFGGGTVASNQKKVLYVDGDITITGNIIYDNWDLDDPNSAPSFALIVKGNINITNDVTRLDGLYVAQPTSPGQRGEFNTCANNFTNQFCNQQLVVNGAVIARHILPLRSVGTVSRDANPDGFEVGHNPAEIFNFIPSMIISTPPFAPIHNNLEGLFSLPPVF